MKGSPSPLEFSSDTVPGDPLLDTRDPLGTFFEPEEDLFEGEQEREVEDCVMGDQWEPRGGVQPLLDLPELPL